jgi:adenosylcobinamide-GDP ribazoletransferase
MQDETPPRDANRIGWWDDLLFAFGCLTRLPLSFPETMPHGALARAGWAFPLVGVVIGLLGGIAFSLAAALGLPAPAAALIALGVSLAATGAIHEDGLADTVDGFGGGADRERKLAIMRDHHIGAYGVLALLLSVGLRVAALTAIADGGRVAAALIAAHALARGGLPTVLYALDPARNDGQGAAAGRPEPVTAAVAAAIGAVLALFGLGVVAGIGAVIAAGAAMALVALLARRQIGGYTGDVLGAIEQTGEVVMLLAGAAWAI